MAHRNPPPGLWQSRFRQRPIDPALIQAPLSVPVFTFDFPGAQHTHLRGINTDGDIVGFYDDGTLKHGFLLRRGYALDKKFVIKPTRKILRRVDVPATFVPGQSISTFVEGINDAGFMVGRFEVGKDIVGGYRLNPLELDASVPAKFIQIPNIDDATGINNRLDIVGGMSRKDIFLGFLLRGGTKQGPGTTLTPIQVGNFTEVWGVNDSDDVVGTKIVTNGQTNSFVKFKGKTPIDIRFATLNETFSRGRGISGDIVVGQLSLDFGANQRSNGLASVWTSSSPKTGSGFSLFPQLPIAFRALFGSGSQPATSTFANGINSRGDIVGEYKDGAGQAHGFLLPNYANFQYWEASVIKPLFDIAVGDAKFLDPTHLRENFQVPAQIKDTVILLAIRRLASMVVDSKSSERLRRVALDAALEQLSGTDVQES